MTHIRALWAEAAPLLPEFGQDDIAAYTDALTSRFSVSALEHRLSQIAMDGSAKLQQRILPILRHHRFQAPAASRVLGDWWRVLTLRDGRGEPAGRPDGAGPAGCDRPPPGRRPTSSVRSCSLSVCRPAICPPVSRRPACRHGRNLNRRIAIPEKPDKNTWDGI